MLQTKNYHYYNHPVHCWILTQLDLWPGCTKTSKVVFLIESQVRSRSSKSSLGSSTWFVCSSSTLFEGFCCSVSVSSTAALSSASSRRLSNSPSFAVNAESTDSRIEPPSLLFRLSLAFSSILTKKSMNKGVVLEYYTCWDILCFGPIASAYVAGLHLFGTHTLSGTP